jgi:hypothetical protein
LNQAAPNPSFSATCFMPPEHTHFPLASLRRAGSIRANVRLLSA